jgi:type 1 glutamine amidotransferase
MRPAPVITKTALMLTAFLLGQGIRAGDVPSERPSVSKPLRALILSGQNNHDWKATTPRLTAILEEEGLFTVDVTENPGLLTVPFLERYDVLVSNWNSFGLGPEAERWPEEAKQATLDFVRRGKGHVVVHAGGASFSGWEDYARLALATWKAGQTSHGPRHEFSVRIDAADHPVAAGLGTFKTSDELWNKPAVSEGAEVVASSFSALDKEGTGQWEPAALVGRFGQGRSFTLLLGHDTQAMENPGFQALLKRGVEWAATGRAAGTAGPRASDRRGGWQWELEEGKSVSLHGAGGVLWRFRFDPMLDAAYFHPLNTVDGQTLTWDAPPDHVWHHGLWFSWKFINKVNYWEIDPKIGRPPGQTTWKNVEVENRPDGSATITMDLNYRPAGVSDPVMTEERTIDVARPDAEGGYFIDWTCVFTAVGDVVLDRTPLPGEPEGQVWGGYSGLSMRLAKDVVERQVVSSDGPVLEFQDDRYRGKHAAMDYSGILDGRAIGMAILDHPDNPRSPTPWYVIRSAEMSFFSPAVICYGPMTLPAGRRLSLRYRVFVHSGRWDAGRLLTEARRFGESR